MSDRHPRNDEAAAKVTDWRPVQPCALPYTTASSRICERGTIFCPVHHDAPDMRSDAMVVKMIEWLICPVPLAGIVYGVLIDPDANGYAVQLINDNDEVIQTVTGRTLADALIEAVLAAPEVEAKVR
jgi:hypothetical protein